MDVLGVAGGKGSVWLGNGRRRENLNDDTPQQQGKVTYPDMLTGPGDPQNAAPSSAVHSCPRRHFFSRETDRNLLDKAYLQDLVWDREWESFSNMPYVRRVQRETKIEL